MYGRDSLGDLRDVGGELISIVSVCLSKPRQCATAVLGGEERDFRRIEQLVRCRAIYVAP